jgi:CheY-like chemotaxis protein
MRNLLTDQRLLVVEDETLVLLMIEDMLIDFGCSSVATAATVDKAVALIGRHTFDAAMLDMNLNGRDSLPVAKALAADGVPFLFCTANAIHDVKEAYPDRPVLNKPFKFEQLGAILSRLLSR